MKIIRALLCVISCLAIPVCKAQSTFVCDGGSTTTLTASISTMNYIDSYNYPNDYSNDGGCNVLIIAPETYVVKITVENYVQRITSEKFKVFNGTTSSDEKLIEKSQLKSGNSFKSSDRYIYITHSSGSRNDAFRISYIAVSETPTCALGLTTYVANSTENYFYSHSTYPSDYVNNMDSYWLIVKSNADDKLVYYFDTFLTETDNNGCKLYDRLLVYNGACTTSSVEDRFCGLEDQSEHVVTGGKYILFRMVTDGSFTEKGFHLKFYTKEGDVYTDEENLSWIAGPIVGGSIVLIIVGGHRQQKKDEKAKKQLTKEEKDKRFWLAMLIMVILAVHIAMIVIGAKFFHNCPVKSFIPIGLIVNGSIGVGFYLMTFLDDNDPKQKKCFGNILFFVIAVGFGFIIAGSVNVFTVASKWVDDPVNSPEYCHPVLYRFAFAIYIAYLATIGLSILLCVICKDKKK